MPLTTWAECWKLFSGPPGSGKTAAARLARELEDPVGLEHAAAVLK